MSMTTPQSINAENSLYIVFIYPLDDTKKNRTFDKTQDTIQSQLTNEQQIRHHRRTHAGIEKNQISDR